MQTELQSESDTVRRIKLTARQENFALAYVATSNASEAYRRAFGVAPNTKPETIWSESSRILKNRKVTARVIELQAMNRDAMAVSVESLTIELEEARQMALEARNESAAIAATLGKAKLHGLLSERRELSGSAERPASQNVVHSLDRKSALMILDLVR